MLRQDIRIGDYSEKGTELVTYKYIADLYKAGVDLKDDIRKNYVMIRKYNVINDLVYDTDLYIIERDILENDPDSIVFPMTNKAYVGFSKDKKAFNSNLNKSNFKIGGFEVYDIMRHAGDKKFELADVPCDVLKIYHPHNKQKLQSVIYVDTIVASVKVHLFCKPYLSLSPSSEQDFEIDGIRYSEYVTCYIPDIEWLMGGDAYYEERISLVKTGLADGSTVVSDLICSPTNGLSDDRTYASLKIYTIPFVIEEQYDEPTDDNDKFILVETEDKIAYQHANDDTHSILHDVDERYDTREFAKRYIIDLNDSVAQDYVEYPLRVTIAPYTTIDESTGIFINDSRLTLNSDVMQDDAKMTLAASISFDDDGNPSLVCKFQFPGKDNFSTFREAYEHFYRVDLNDYTGIIEYDEDDIDEEEEVEQKQCGFILTFYSDYNMTAVMQTEVFELDDPAAQLDDFAFQLQGVFQNWDQLPDTLIVEARFMDRWLGNVIASNPVFVHNEAYKYFVNDDNDSRSIIKWEGTEAVHHTTQDMDLSNINFIDKIHCTIRRSASDGTGVNSSSAGPKVLYKPVFYRTQDLQNIVLRAGIVQNIGIALPEYMTKVESFKLTISGQTIVESARNDIYAIFSVNGATLNEGSGSYHISNQDGEYISSGDFKVIP